MSEGNLDFSAVVRAICEEDRRYQRGAYYFVRQALDYSLRNLKQVDANQQQNHLSGQQLLEGIRCFALEQYGPMAQTVFDRWGIHDCRDFGQVVFNLVECRVLGKTEEDSPSDFAGGYDFSEAFEKPFRPRKKLPIKRPRLL